MGRSHDIQTIFFDVKMEDFVNGRLGVRDAVSGIKQAMGFDDPPSMRGGGDIVGMRMRHHGTGAIEFLIPKHPDIALGILQEGKEYGNGLYDPESSIRLIAAKVLKGLHGTYAESNPALAKEAAALALEAPIMDTNHVLETFQDELRESAASETQGSGSHASKLAPGARKGPLTRG